MIHVHVSTSRRNLKLDLGPKMTQELLDDFKKSQSVYGRALTSPDEWLSAASLVMAIEVPVEGGEKKLVPISVEAIQSLWLETSESHNFNELPETIEEL